MGREALILQDRGQKVGITGFSQFEVAFEFFKGLFDLGELEVVFPHFDRIVRGRLRVVRSARV